MSVSKPREEAGGRKPLLLPPRASAPRAAFAPIWVAGTYTREPHRAAEAPTRTVTQGWHIFSPQETPEGLKTRNTASDSPLPSQGWCCLPGAYTGEEQRVSPSAGPFLTVLMVAPRLRLLPAHRMATTQGHRPSVTLQVPKHPDTCKHPTCRETESVAGFGIVVQDFTGFREESRNSVKTS